MAKKKKPVEPAEWPQPDKHPEVVQPLKPSGPESPEEEPQIPPEEEPGKTPEEIPPHEIYQMHP